MVEYNVVYDVGNWFCAVYWSSVGFLPAKGIDIVTNVECSDETYLLELGQVLKWPVLDHFRVY